MNAPLLSVRDLDVRFDTRAGTVRAVEGVSFDLAPGETLAVVGESGCGKSTLARAILQLVPAAAGSVKLEGVELSQLDRKALRACRRDMQVIFQDPLASLDPRMTVGGIVAEPLRTHHPRMGVAECARRVRDILGRVGLPPDAMQRHPHEFSGGQCQRIGIARALVLEPKLVLCDEPVSALDVSVRAQVINLLSDLKREFGLALVFIAHDLSVVRHVSDRVMVMYMGRVVELASRDAVFTTPRHPYTQALLESVPVPDPRAARRRRAPLPGDLPSPLDLPSGCAFRTRCPHAQPRCAAERPGLRDLGATEVACHYAEALPSARA